MPTLHLVHGDEIETGELKINVATPTVEWHGHQLIRYPTI